MMGQAKWKREHPSQPYDTQREARLRSGAAERADMRQFLEEMLEWRDPDELIARPLDDEGWHRMVDYNLRRWRQGRAGPFAQWRKRRDLRGSTDLELRLDVCAALNLTWHKLDDERRKIVRKACATWGMPESEWEAHLKDLL
jgi:hypothetical protein